MSTLKENLYQQCLDYVHKRMEAAEQGIREATLASQDDTKSSAGDKYETGREMAQQETNRNMAQLAEANKLKIALNAINATVQSITVVPGSVVYTNSGNFFLSISAGTLSADGKTFFAVSPASPIGAQLLGKKMADEFSLNGKRYEILEVE